MNVQLNSKNFVRHELTDGRVDLGECNLTRFKHKHYYANNTRPYFIVRKENPKTGKSWLFDHEYLSDVSLGLKFKAWNLMSEIFKSNDLIDRTRFSIVMFKHDDFGNWSISDLEFPVIRMHCTFDGSCDPPANYSEFIHTAHGTLITCPDVGYITTPSFSNNKPGIGQIPDFVIYWRTENTSVELLEKIQSDHPDHVAVFHNPSGAMRVNHVCMFRRENRVDLEVGPDMSFVLPIWFAECVWQFTRFVGNIGPSKEYAFKKYLSAIPCTLR